MTVAVASNGKRSVQAELNLVPFIDFLSVLISFLLVSAVWTQLSRLEVAPQSDAGQGIAPPDPAYAPLVLHIDERGLVLSRGPIEKTVIPKKGTEQDYEALQRTLAAIKATESTRDAISIAASPNVNYEAVIRVTDICIKLGLPQVDIGPLQNR